MASFFVPQPHMLSGRKLSLFKNKYTVFAETSMRFMIRNVRLPHSLRQQMTVYEACSRGCKNRTTTPIKTVFYLEIFHSKVDISRNY